MKFIFALGVVAALVATTLYSGGDESGFKSPAQGAGPSLVAHWRLDEVTGTTAADSSPNGNDGTLVNMDPTTDWVPGKIGGALDFDGIDDHAVIANNPSLAIVGTEITLAAWINPRDGGASGGSRIMSKRTDAGGSDVYAMYTQDNRLRFRLDGTDSVSSNTFNTNEWLHVVMVYDGTDKRIYWNGALDPATPQAKADPIDTSTRAVHLGMREGQARQFNGLMDELRIYDRALSATEVLDLYSGAPSPDTTPPSVPQGVTVIGVTSTVVDLSWTAAVDPESGIEHYNVYRDNVLVGQSATPSFLDSGLTSATIYAYEVSAVNGATLESSRSAPPVNATTLADGEPPIAFPSATWEFKLPSEVGLDGAKLDEFSAAVGGSGVIVKDGYMVKTWGDQTTKFDWGSARKSVMSTMLFFAAHEGKLNNVDGLVRPYVQQILPGQDLIDEDQTMTFRHLANMVSGYALPEAPGTAWGYNDYATSLYNKTLFDGVFQQTSNEAATDPNRLGALQFQDGSIFSSRQGYGVSTTPRDFARIGWFWLNKGNWNGTQILPQTYFDSYMKPDAPGNLPRTAGGTNDYLNIYFTGGGTNQTPLGPGIYGFNWWFNATVGTSTSITWPDAPTDAFQANGHWNREVVTVMPSLGIVAAWRGTGNDPASFNEPMNNYLKILADSLTPTVYSCSPASVAPNSWSNVVVIGSGFQNGIVVDFGAMTRVQKVTLIDDSRLEVRIRVNRKAVPGPLSVTVTNPDGLSGTKVGCVTVT